MTPQERMAQALLSSQAVVPPTDPTAMPAMPGPPQNPFVLNQPLEQAVQTQTQAPPVNPIIAALMQKVGLLSMIRNRRNVPGADPEIPIQ